jgi:hypothetical protein
MDDITSQINSVHLSLTPNSLPTELLQHIFSYLSLPALLKCRCVCHLWNACIPGDFTELRQALFLRSRTAPEPLSESSFVLYFDIHTDVVDNSPSTVIGPIRKIEKVLFDRASIDIAVHPFITQAERYIVPLEESEDETRSASLRNKAGELVHPADSGMLKTMRATWPPVGQLFVYFVYRGRDGVELNARPGLQHWRLWDDAGVHFLDVFEEIEAQIKGLLSLDGVEVDEAAKAQAGLDEQVQAIDASGEE